MSDPAQAEAALRLAGERSLVGHRRDRPQSAELGEVASALVLLCGLPQPVADSIVEDYTLAQSFRGHGRPPLFQAARRRARQQARTPPAHARATAPVVVECEQSIDVDGTTVSIRSVIFTGSSCLIAAHSDGPLWKRSRSQRGSGPIGPPQLTVTDDQGATAGAHFSGGGTDDGWDGEWTTNRPMSSSTQWLDISGSRIELGDRTAPAPAWVEALPDEQAAHRYLWHRIAARAEHEAPTSDTLPALLASLGVLDPADPITDDLADAARALDGEPLAAKTKTRLPAPWRSLLQRHGNEDGPTGRVALAATTPELDRTVITVYDMQSESDGFTLQTRMAGENTAISPAFHDHHPGTPFAWWAEDDRGNSYLGHWQDWSGGDGEVSGEIRYQPALDEAARQLRVMPTSLTHRAVIDIAIPEWQAAR